MKLLQNLNEGCHLLLPWLMSGMIDPSLSSGQVVESLGIVADEKNKHQTNQS
jgi:hypothetical protein